MLGQHYARQLALDCSNGHSLPFVTEEVTWYAKHEILARACPFCQPFPVATPAHSTQPLSTRFLLPNPNGNRQGTTARLVARAAVVWLQRTLAAAERRYGRCGPLVLASTHHAVDSVLDLLRRLTRHQVPVEIKVGDPKLILVCLSLPQASRRRLAEYLLGDPKVTRQLPDFALDQVPQRQDVDAAIAKLGEVADRYLAPRSVIEMVISMPGSKTPIKAMGMVLEPEKAVDARAASKEARHEAEIEFMDGKIGKNDQKRIATEL